MNTPVPTASSSITAGPQSEPGSTRGRGVKFLISGALMGLANLVPGVSAGAVLLATGIFREFVEALADLARFTFRRKPVIMLILLGIGWVTAVLLGAGPVKALVVDYRWIMYSLFVGLTLGGVPLVWQPSEERSRGFWVGAVMGFGVMAALGAVQIMGINIAGQASTSIPMLVLGGLLAAGATVLPGGSGTFVLLLLGLYVPILSAVANVKDHLIARDFAGLLVQARILAPLAFGMGIGLVSVSVLTKWALAKHPRPSFGILLGLLIGSVVGLLPFQRGVEPIIGQMFKGRPMSQELISKMKPEDWPVQVFSPEPWQVLVAFVLVVGATMATIWLTRVETKLEAEQARSKTGAA